MNSKISRRKLLRSAFALGTVTLVSACATGTPFPPTSSQPAATGASVAGETSTPGATTAPEATASGDVGTAPATQPTQLNRRRRGRLAQP